MRFAERPQEGGDARSGITGGQDVGDDSHGIGTGPND
jgi:hypothetical protein